MNLRSLHLKLTLQKILAVAGLKINMAFDCCNFKAMISVFLVIKLRFLNNVNCLTQYSLMQLQTGSFTQQIAAADQTACLASCSTNLTAVTAVSYSNYYHKCVVSTCSNVGLSPSALWETVLCCECFALLINVCISITLT